jgi:hypothetical protein
MLITTLMIIALILLAFWFLLSKIKKVLDINIEIIELLLLLIDDPEWLEKKFWE